jgi:hypothetical protein
MICNTSCVSQNRERRFPTGISPYALALQTALRRLLQHSQCQRASTCHKTKKIRP